MAGLAGLAAKLSQMRPGGPELQPVEDSQSGLLDWIGAAKRPRHGQYGKEVCTGSSSFPSLKWRNKLDVRYL